MDRLGRYELLGEIASGGMARVHLARIVGEGGFEREVAVKVMHSHLASDPDFIAMFLDEARLAARIRHPNVVATLDVQKTDEATFLVMDFVEGVALSTMQLELKRRKERMPVSVALRVAIDMLHGLHAAHELTDREGRPQNLVHRDVSPPNILVGIDGVARITDFGVARAEARLSSTDAGQVKGKVPYMAPEQIAADEVDRRADVYGAAVVLWEMFTGRRLFTAKHQGALLVKVLDGAQTPPRKKNPEVPPGVDAVCMKALSVDPSRRFETAASFAQALQQAAQGVKLAVASPLEAGKYVRKFESNTRALEARRAAPRPAPDSSSSPEESERSAQSQPGLGEPVTTGATGTGSVVSTGATVEERRAPHRRLTLGVLAGVLLGGAAVFMLVRGPGPTVGPPSEAAGPGSGAPAEPAPDDSGERPVAMATPAESSSDAPQVDEEPDAGPAPAATGSATIRRPAVSAPQAAGAKKGGGKQSGGVEDYLPSEL